MLTYCGRIAGESIDLLWENSRKKCSEILTSWQLSVYHFNWRICLPSFLSFINWRLGPGTASVHRGCPSWGHKTLHIRLRMHLEAWPTGLDFSASAVRTPRQFWLICAFSTLSLLPLCLRVCSMGATFISAASSNFWCPSITSQALHEPALGISLDNVHV